MGATAAAGYAIGLGPVPAPSDLFAMPFTGAFTLSPIALHLDISGVLTLGFLPVLLTLVLMSFLDTLGTLVGVGAAGNMLDKDGNFPRSRSRCWSTRCRASSRRSWARRRAAPTSIRHRHPRRRAHGLAAVVTGGLFLASLFLLPIVAPLQQSQYIYGPALVAVGMLMVGSVRKIDFDDLTEALPRSPASR